MPFTRPPRRAALVIVFAVMLATVTAVSPVSAVSAAGTAAQVRRCNGGARLCDLPLGAVAFATSHNSMSSAADGFIGPNQGATMAQQLEQGIRGFQIDAYPGFARKGRVYTDLQGPFGAQATDLSPTLVRTARLIHQRLGAPPPGTPSEVYLCHTFCELGGIRMSEVARDIRRFLDDHPDEVLVFVVEDYVPPERLQAVFDAAGLGNMLLPVAGGDPLPTLGAMIDSGERMLVSLENGDGGPTLPNAFAGLVEETPFTFLRASELRNSASCPPNRGVDGAPIFQFNHWVTPPSRGRARAVNGAALRARVEQCTDARGRIPTLVAVDFAERSDVVAVVRNLNRGPR